MDGQLITVFYAACSFIDIGKVQLWMYTLCVEIHGQCNHIDITGTFAIAEQRTFYPISTCHHAQFSRGNCRTSIIMRMQ